MKSMTNTNSCTVIQSWVRMLLVVALCMWGQPLLAQPAESDTGDENAPQILTTDLGQRTQVHSPTLKVSFVIAGANDIAQVSVNGSKQKLAPGDTQAVSPTFRFQPGQNMVEIMAVDTKGHKRIKTYLVEYIPETGTPKAVAAPQTPASQPFIKERRENGGLYIGAHSDVYTINYGKTDVNENKAEVSGSGIYLGVKQFFDETNAVGASYAKGDIKNVTVSGAAAGNKATSQSYSAQGKYETIELWVEHNVFFESAAFAVGLGMGTSKRNFTIFIPNSNSQSKSHNNKTLDLLLLHGAWDYKIGSYFVFGLSGDIGVIVSGSGSDTDGIKADGNNKMSYNHNAFQAYVGFAF